MLWIDIKRNSAVRFFLLDKMARLWFLLTFVAFASCAPGKRHKLEENDRSIIGGHEIDISQAPYIVQVLLSDTDPYHCGGSIIDATHILTAAHCLTTYIPTVVRTGSTKAGKGKMYRIKDLVVHESYTGSGDYDVGVITLEEKLEFNNNTQPIKLAEKEPEEGELSKTSGWGRTHFGGPASENLLQVEVHIVGRTTCQSLYSNNPHNVTERMICAGEKDGGKDACQGDSGGPLTVGDKLVGVVSWGEECALPDYPGVYVNVANVLDWIKNHLN